MEIRCKGECGERKPADQFALVDDCFRNSTCVACAAAAAALSAANGVADPPKRKQSSKPTASSMRSSTVDPYSARTMYARQASLVGEWTKHTNRHRLSRVKEYARYNKIPWDIEDYIAGNIINSPCHYTGISDVGEHWIDRIDDSIGFVESNCVPCNEIVSYMKGRMNHKAFLEVCKLQNTTAKQAMSMATRYDICMKLNPEFTKKTFRDLCEKVVVGGSRPQDPHKGAH